MSRKLRVAIPNGITFLSLTCGVVSLMLSTSGFLKSAGLLILASYILDLLDGSVARKLNADTEFGLQLDSLVDMVSLGTAPAVLVFVHLNSKPMPSIWIWPFAILLPLAGAFRLARFNLLPPKSGSSKDSVGLTITTGGAIFSSVVLTDLTWSNNFLTESTFLALLAIVSFLMVGKLAFPSASWFFPNRWVSIVLLLLIAISVWQSSVFVAWFFWTVTYMVVSVVRSVFSGLGSVV